MVSINESDYRVDRERPKSGKENVMKELKDKILSDGEGIGDSIVKVDGFLNHQLDVELMEKIGLEFARLAGDRQVDKIMTVEASGIAVACFTARALGNIPAVFAKKAKPSTLTDGFFTATAKSFTKGTESNLILSKKFLKEGENIIVIDDFLAHGEAGAALLKIAEEAKVNVVYFGAVIEKCFQNGRAKLEPFEVEVNSLAEVVEIKDGYIKMK